MGQSTLLTYRRIWIIGVHIVLWLISYYASFLLRFDFDIPERYSLQTIMGWFTLLMTARVCAFFAVGGFKGLWKYTGARDLDILVKGTFFASVVFALTLLLLQERAFPRSIIFIEGMLALSLVGGLRFLIRKINEVSAEIRSSAGPKKRILIVGAGDAGEALVRDLQKNLSFQYEAIGFVDDNPLKMKAQIHGVPVIGKIESIPKLARLYHIDEIVIAIPTATGSKLREIMEHCVESEAQIRAIPGLNSVLDGRVTWSQVREINIDDLLGRESVHLEEDNIASYIQGKVIMITGAGGSIGGELCRQVLRFHPQRLILVERAEYNLFQIHREISEKFKYVEIIPCLADVSIRTRVQQLFNEHSPDTVFHAAAHKHVPMIEWNPSEAVTNNVRATRVLAEEAISAGVDRFVYISSDKAVRPTSVMGASKRIGELLLQSYTGEEKTSFITVRFGNVLGSAGSVIPIFKEQIKNGGPVTVTHPEMVRFFMTIPEACQLVMQAGAMGEGGEIFILDMGEPVRVVDLARDLIRLSGFNPDTDIDIQFTGVRPGEKLYEEIAVNEENASQTRHPKIYIGRHTLHSNRNVIGKIIDLENDAEAGAEAQRMKERIREIVPEFSYKELNSPKRSTTAEVISLPRQG